MIQELWKLPSTSIFVVILRFIEKYVLCPVCHLPEIRIKVKKDTITSACRSCGKVSKLDSVHKLATYILKNPPKDDSEFSKTKKHGDKGKKDTEDKKTKHGHSKGDKSKGSKQGEEEKAPEALTLESPEIIETIERIREYKDSQKRTANELVDQITNICISQGLKSDLRYYAAIHGLYDDEFLYQWNQEESSKEAIKTMVMNEGKAQYWVLLALERFILQNHGIELAQHINTIVKCFYDYEILDEETILKCYEKEEVNKVLVSGKTYSQAIHSDFKAQIAPFVNWLNEAEVDDAEEEEKAEEKNEEEDEATKKQRELIEEQQKLQEQELKENKEKTTEDKQTDGDTKLFNILDIKTEPGTASIDDL